MDPCRPAAGTDVRALGIYRGRGVGQGGGPARALAVALALLGRERVRLLRVRCPATGAEPVPLVPHPVPAENAHLFQILR